MPGQHPIIVDAYGRPIKNTEIVESPGTAIIPFCDYCRVFLPHDLPHDIFDSDRELENEVVSRCQVRCARGPEYVDLPIRSSDPDEMTEDQKSEVGRMMIVTSMKFDVKYYEPMIGFRCNSSGEYEPVDM